jgi:hypothetical protein
VHQISSYRQQYAAAILFLLSASLSQILLANSAQIDNIQIRNAWVKPTLEGFSVSTVYFDIVNYSSKTITLTNITGDVANAIEIHEHVMKNGLMKMQAVKEGIRLTANQGLSFKPGGYHIMLMNLKKMIKEGDKITLTLHFTSGDIKVMTATAKTITYHHH